VKQFSPCASLGGFSRIPLSPPRPGGELARHRKIAAFPCRTAFDKRRGASIFRPFAPAGALIHPSTDILFKDPPMPEIAVKKGEPIDRALKRLKSKIETEGTLEEFRRRRQHETLTQRKKRKAKSAAKKKNQKYRFVP